MGGGFGLIGDIIIGIIGAFIGAWLWGALHLPTIGNFWINAIVISTVGASSCCSSSDSSGASGGLRFHCRTAAWAHRRHGRDVALQQGLGRTVGAGGNARQNSADTAQVRRDKMRDKPWIFRTYAGHSTAAESNALYRKNLAKGQTGLSVAFDLPTQTGYDSDHVLAQGRGRQGRRAGLPSRRHARVVRRHSARRR